MQDQYMPVGGTPLLPPSYLTAYFALFITLLIILYIYFYRQKRPVFIWQKVKLFIVIAVILKATLISGIGLLGFYWLVPTPGVRRTIPVKESTSFSPTNKVEIIFDRPVSRSVMVKSISPEVPGHWVFENSLYTTHLYRNLVFYPTYSLRPNTKYTVNLSDIRNLIDVSKPYDYQFEFTTQSSPNLVAVSPVSGQHEVKTNEKIRIKLDNPNDDISEFDFQFIPHIDFDLSLDTSKTEYTITPKTELISGTSYNLKVLKSDVILNLEDRTVVERSASSLVYDGNFITKEAGGLKSLNIFKQPIKVAFFSPENGVSAVNVGSKVRVSFDQDVNHSSAENMFNISPKVDGDFSWDGNALIFTPKENLEYSTTYDVSISKGVSGPDGLSSDSEFKTQFSTQNATVKLDAPAYLQKYTLSCEIASLRMALNFKGLSVTEDELIPKIGTDPTPHNGNIWGDPNKAFVGNVRGTQMSDGYGVHWAPIAKAAREYRSAQEFEGWSIELLTKAISEGHPVVIWVYSHFGTPTSWNTPDGTKIYAVRDEHAVVAVGFVGPANNPTQIIINDPLIGQVYWSRSSFDKKWGIFNQSGVVVY